MPIVDVIIVGPCNARSESELAQSLADAVGTVLGAGEGRAWVRVQSLPTTQYAENASAVQVPPVFLEILHYELPNPTELQSQARAIADSVAAVLERPSDSVHVRTPQARPNPLEGLPTLSSCMRVRCR
jgi:phenylpyruvate tautomerase PptA (4-oxalocrotonate tautomerase family)